MSVQPHAMDQAALLRAPVEYLGQSGIFRVRNVAYKRRLRHWAIGCFFTISFIASLILSSATWFTSENCGSGFEALKARVPEALDSVNSASIRDFYRLALRAINAYSAVVQYGTEEFKQVYKSHHNISFEWPKPEAQ